jgi:hypothetical protein
MAKRKKERDPERKLDGPYAQRLNAIIDKLFDVAAKKHWTWEQMAEESGLSRSTIFNLGSRLTKYPQHRTVELLARALGGRLAFVKGEEAKHPKPTWTLKLFSGRRKKDKDSKAA